jgi:hypothetical protein
MKGFPKIFPILLLLFLSACHRDIPTPKSRPNGEKINGNDAIDYPVSGKPIEPRFFVHHNVKGKNVFIECKLTDISFRNDHKQNIKSGKILVFVDGQKHLEIDSPVFIVKELTSGHHTIKLEVVDKENQPYDLRKEFSVTIP